MAKPKKAATDTSVLVVSRAEYFATREQVISSLNALQQGLLHVHNTVADLARHYIKHSASVLNDVPEEVQRTSNLIESAIQSDAGKKRKREKKEKDPDAPKRPLTAAFLFAQSARRVIKQDLERAAANGKLEPNAVNLEVNKRWNEMPDEEKETWKASYRNSMEVYNIEMDEYKKSLVLKKAALDEDVPEEEVSDEAESEALDTDTSDDSDDDSPAIAPTTKESTPPPTASKTSRPTKRQKIANGSFAPVPIAPATGVSPVPLPSASSSKPMQTQVHPPGWSIDVQSPAPKNNKKKGKAAPQPIAPAPANDNDEPDPIDNKKKGKSGRSMRNADVEPETPAAENKVAKKRDRSKRKSVA